jgi:hypothetical protein
MCHGPEFGCIPIFGDGHQFIYWDLYMHCKDSHSGIDDHAADTMFGPWHICIYR